MGRYDNCNCVEHLANAYGYDMMLYGKSLYWSSPRKCEDTTSDLKSCVLFSRLSSGEKSTLLNYGNEMKQYGMGCYQERGYCAELYDRYANKGGIPNPFAGKGSSSSESGQMGM